MLSPNKKEVDMITCTFPLSDVMIRVEYLGPPQIVGRNHKACRATITAFLRSSEPYLADGHHTGKYILDSQSWVKLGLQCGAS